MLENYPINGNEYAVVTTSDSRSGTSITGGQSSILLGYNYRNGTPVQDWKVKVAKGQDASSFYERRSCTIKRVANIANSGFKPWSVPYQYTIQSSGRFQCIGQINTPFANGDVETRSLALQRFKRKLTAASGRTDVMVPIGELTELRRGIRSQASVSTRFLNDILSLKKRSKGMSARNFSGNAQEAWLNYSFMMAPMVSDTQDIAESISAYLHKSTPYSASRIRASATKEGVDSYVPPTSVSNCTFGCKWINTGWVHYRLSYLFTGGWDLFIKSSNNYSALDHFGLRLSKIPAVMWEKLGFSWMIDYFVNVGPFFDDTFYSPPGNLRYMVENIRYESSHQHIFKIQQIPGANLAGYSATDGSGTAEVLYRSFKRYPLSSLPYGSLYVKSLDKIGQNAISKLLNLTSIVFHMKRG